ncbi:11838_t:CDS:2 [Entrophospora sp. SA101]|nr:20149_t:CDS:2 [Entrophospora sp. SA101]CAJ0849251.1 2316_t:CDS:2 [Entrophospora sp. SA101]CAJ0902344.1 11838_t:CDS:2 [Entrophospora sp. SA101]
MASNFLRQNIALVPLLVAASGGVVVGAAYGIYTLTTCPDVVLKRLDGQQPWNKIEQHQNYKLMTINKEFFNARKDIF